ncbi:Fur family transcriptional regulator [Peribacillus butanolivorans]|uniref:Fur family transcriptional regulator n=1 Tax=Peribacillus butanolivorans TaxID=421767 RepID=UPI00207C53DB|nr:Fur family transcriptional regulator [Peribacillus butanolivorans]MCO0598518.1 Fur family transcriptional regulator [Peribacillus butanolivorans]
MTAIIAAITDEFVLISSDRKRSNYDGHGNFSGSQEEWAVKTISLSSHIALSALGELETTTNAKNHLKKALEENPHMSIEDIVPLSQSIFREALLETKKKHANLLNKGKSLFSKKVKPEDIKQNAAYFLGGFDSKTNKTFLYAFINGDDYIDHDFTAFDVYPLGAGQDEMANYINESLPQELNISILKKHFKEAITVAARTTQSVNTNVLHCLVNKSGVKFSEDPSQSKEKEVSE